MKRTSTHWTICLAACAMAFIAGCGGDTPAPAPVATNAGGGAPPPPVLSGGPPAPVVAAVPGTDPAAPVVPGGPAAPGDPMAPGFPAPMTPMGPAGLEPDPMASVPGPVRPGDQPPLAVNPMPGVPGPVFPGDQPPLAVNPMPGVPGPVRPGDQPMALPVLPPVAEGNPRVPPGLEPQPGVPGFPMPVPGGSVPGFPMPIPGGPVPGAPGDPNAPPAGPVTLRDKAKAAFAAGQDGDAMAYYQSAIVIGEAGDDWVGELSWQSKMARTAVALRWGIGVQYSAPSNTAGIAPVGPRTRPAPNQPAANPLDQLPPGGDRTPLGILRSVADPLGPKIVEDLQSRIGEGYYGAILKELASAGNAAGGVPGAVPGGPIGAPGVVPGGVPGAEAVGGVGLPGAGPISPGITFLGVGALKEIVAAGQQEKVDLILILNVTQRTIKNNQVKQVALHLHDAATGKELWDGNASQTTNPNVAVDPNRPAPKKAPEDPLDVLHEKLFRFVDGNTRLAEMPAGLTAANLGPRLATITASPPKQPLAVLVELAYYRAKGLLEQEAWLDAVRKVLGDARALSLSGNDVEQRKQAILVYLPSSERTIGGPRP